LNKEELAKYISGFLPFDCKIEIKNKNNYLINVKKKLFTSDIYIHPVFLKADKNILLDVVDYIKQKKNKLELNIIKKRLYDFFESNRLKKKNKIKKTFKTKNIFCFFDDILKELKIKFSDIDFDLLKITWGKFYKNQKRSIRFGSFDRRNNIIRIHPILDNDIVPDYFIKSVIYHEIAHFIIFNLDKTVKPHSRDFKILLKKIDPDFKNSMKWEKLNRKIFFLI
jgi:predicted metal-dependent hydrolase